MPTNSSDRLRVRWLIATVIVALVGALLSAPAASAQVSPTISVDDTTPTLGQVITYTVALPCSGDGVQTVSVTFPSQISLAGQGYNSNNGLVTVSGSSLTWNPNTNVAQGSPGCPPTLTVNALVLLAAGGAGPLTAQASVGGNTASVTINVAAVPLTISKTVSDVAPERGDQIAYTIEVPCDSFLGPTTITDVLPSGVVRQGSTSSNNGTLTINDPTVQWTPNLDPTLNGGCPAILTISVVVTSGASGIITNTASANGVSGSVDIIVAEFCRGQLVTIDMNTNGGNGQGSNQADVILGTPGADIINAGGGHDIVCGGNGADTIHGDAGIDTIYGDGGNDTIYGDANADRLWGDAGNDTIWGGPSSDKLYGGDGNDTMYGGSGGDLAYGGKGMDTMYGGTDDDRLFGQQGPDTMFGEVGDDRLFGGQNDDRLWGGTGSLTSGDANGVDRLWGETGRDKLYGELGNDFWLDGGDHNDVVFGGGGNDTVRGGDGNDRVYGQTGNDDVRAQAGDDLVTDGGSGTDTCQVAPGNDAPAINCE